MRRSVLLPDARASASHARARCLPYRGPRVKIFISAITPKVSGVTVVDGASPGVSVLGAAISRVASDVRRHRVSPVGSGIERREPEESPAEVGRSGRSNR